MGLHPLWSSLFHLWNAARSKVVVDVHTKQLAVLLTGVARGGGEEGGQQHQVQREALHVVFKLYRGVLQLGLFFF